MGDGANVYVGILWVLVSTMNIIAGRGAHIHLTWCTHKAGLLSMGSVVTAHTTLSTTSGMNESVRWVSRGRCSLSLCLLLWRMGIFFFCQFVHESSAKFEGRAGGLHDALEELVCVVDCDIH